VEIYWLRSNEPPWGDYGRILLNGMSSHLPRIEGRIQLERSAPYVPPITFPRQGDVVVTEAVRAAFDVGLLGALPVRPVDKAKIVKLDWQNWAWDEPPAHLPQSRDPEDYLLIPEHDAELCAQIGSLWEIAPPTVGAGTYKKVSRRPAEFRVAIEVPRDVPAIFRADGVPVVLARKDAGDLLLALTDNGFRLAPVEVHLSNSSQ
jgi:hypothetical protein